MKVNLRTDAKKHNLALMKISTYHKRQDDQIYVNAVGNFDLTYGSWLFDFSPKYYCDIEGGPGINPTVTLDGFNSLPPDYNLYGLDFSLGYTWAYCPRKCPFCIVPKQNNTKDHYSIWRFHNPQFKKICLLNNNTFSDPQWKETFEEIWDANLAIIDENGYDLRLLDHEKAEALRMTKWATPLHFAWDQMEDEKKIRYGLQLLTDHHLRSTSNGVYVLIGFNTTQEEDIHRCQVIHDFGLTPYPMPYKRTKQLMTFKRFINLHYYRKTKTIEEAWKEYGNYAKNRPRPENNQTQTLDMFTESINVQHTERLDL